MMHLCHFFMVKLRGIEHPVAKSFDISAVEV